MCTGFEPLLLEAGAGEMFLGDMLATGAGEGLAGLGAAEAAGGGAFLGDMAATGAGGGLTAGGLGTAGMAGLGGAGGLGYLESLGGLDTLAGSQFAESMAPFTSSATDVASITNNAVPGLENNIGDLGNFEGIPPQAPEPIPGLSQASNFRTLSDPELADVMKGVNPNFTNSFAPTTTTPTPSMSLDQMNGGNFLNGMESVANTEGAGVAGAAGGTYGATGSPFSLSNMMSNPMGMVKSAYDTVSKNPIPSMYAAGSLYDMYAKNKMAEAQKGMYNQNRADIMNTYAPGSPEYNLLQQQIARKDAAAGRNSQYGTRANELAGTIAKLRMGALGTLQQGQNTLGNQALSNQYGMFNTPLALAMYSQKPNAAATASY
jgi:hypothetical protein